MLRRYELTDEEWLRIEPLLPPENTGKQGRPRKDNRIIMNGIVWLARSGAPGAIFLNVMVQRRAPGGQVPLTKCDQKFE